MSGRVLTRVPNALPLLRERLAREDGVTLSEMLVVMAILGTVLAGMGTLFLSASNSQVDQSNRHQAQHNARLALDSLRREIRCASGATLTPSALTVTLPGSCQKPAAASAAPFTWCASGAAAPYALWRYQGSACSGTGRRVAESLQSNAIFTYNRSSVVGAPALTPATSGTAVKFRQGLYFYVVTAVDAAGKEASGTTACIKIGTVAQPGCSLGGLTTNRVTVDWASSTYPGAVTYNVYGRDDGSSTATGMRLLATCPDAGNPNCTATSYTDIGAPPAASPPPPVSPPPVTSGQSPPLGTVSVSLAFDLTPADGIQRFALADDIVLRNSGRR